MRLLLLILFTLSAGLSAQTMHKAIKKGDLKQVKAIVKADRKQLTERYDIEKPLPIVRMRGKVTPLFDAVLYGRYEIIKYFIEQRVDLKKENHALFLALLQKGERIKNLLIKNGAEFADDNVPHLRFNVLTTAVAFYPDVELIRQIIDLGGGMEQNWGEKGNYTHTPLGMATRQMKYNIAKLLIERGAKLNLRRNNGQIGLHDAIFYSNIRGSHKGFTPDLLNLLIKNGGDRSHRDDNGYTPMEYAALEGVMPALKILWDESYDRNSRDFDGMTLLHKTAVRGYTDCTEFLMEKGFDVNAKDRYGYTPLHYAYKHGNRSVAELLKKRGGVSDRLKACTDLKKMLSKKLKRGQAYVWYLGRTGWVIKTKDCLIIKPWNWGERRSDDPSLLNGQLVASELINQNVIFIGSKRDAETLVPGDAFLKSRSPEFNFTLISQSPSKSKQIKSVAVTPGKELVTDGVEIYSDNMGSMLISSDGIKILLQGWGSKLSEDFIKAVNMADLAFLNVWGGRNTLPEGEVKRSEEYIKKFKIKTLFSQSMYTAHYHHNELSLQLKKRGNNIRVPINKFPGDCFLYDRGKADLI